MNHEPIEGLNRVRHILITRATNVNFCISDSEDYTCSIVAMTEAESNWKPKDATQQFAALPTRSRLHKVHSAASASASSGLKSLPFATSNTIRLTLLLLNLRKEAHISHVTVSLIVTVMVKTSKHEKMPFNHRGVWRAFSLSFKMNEAWSIWYSVLTNFTTNFSLINSPRVLQW